MVDMSCMDCSLGTHVGFPMLHSGERGTLAEFVWSALHRDWHLEKHVELSRQSPIVSCQLKFLGSHLPWNEDK